MKIYFLIADLGAGGQERQLTYLLSGLQAKSHSTKVLIWNESGDHFYSDTIKRLGIEVQLIRSNSPMSKIKALRKIIRTEKPDVLQSFSFYLNIYAFIACMFSRSKAFGAIRSSMELYKESTPGAIFLLSSLFPGRFVSNNHSFSSGMKGWHKKRLEKQTYVIPNSISKETFHSSAALPKPDQENILMVSVGRISLEKRIDLLVKAHKKLREKGFFVKHKHAGNGPDAAKIRELCSELGVQDTFELLGVYSNVAELLSSADIFVHSSEYEGSPNAVMEAVAMGLPAISTNCGDVKHIIDEGEGGFVVDTGDWAAIADKAGLLISNPTLRTKMRSHNLEISRERFSIEKQVDKYLEAYTNAN